jgi:tripartite-type tricarboxylate transporter receptor subunit TctC
LSNIRRRTVLAGGVAAALGRSWPALGQDFPERPLELLVPFAPGGLTDVVARLVGEPLARELGQAVVVRNVVGAGGNIAFGQLARAKPDGYTLGLLSISVVTNSILRKGGGFDPVASFRPVGYIGMQPFVLLVNPNRLDVRTAAQALEKAKRQPGALNYSSGGLGAPSHVLMEYMKAMQGVNILHVPYNGQTAAIQAVLAGDVHMTLQTVTGAEELIRSGRLRPLAATGPARMTMFPDVPTFEELKINGMEGTGWMGIAAPAGLPDAQAARLAQALAKVMASADVQRALGNRGVELQASSDFPRLIREDRQYWEAAIRGAKIRLD